MKILPWLLLAGALATAYHFSGSACFIGFKPEMGPANLVAPFAGLFVVVALVERLIEVFVGIWHGAKGKQIKANARAAQAGGDRGAAGNDAVSYSLQLSAQTKRVTLAAGFLVGIVVASTGVGILPTFLDLVGEASGSCGDHQFLRFVDILLTAGLIAGGSDGFHSFTTMVLAYLDELRDGIANPSAASSGGQGPDGGAPPPPTPVPTAPLGISLAGSAGTGSVPGANAVSQVPSQPA